jgi:8-oxo-dGTP pyrophosphatase MutT (NUDIX family)
VIEAEPGVSVLAMDGQGNVYLVKEFKYALGGWSIEVATGGRRAGEKPLAGAKRELKEELGIQAKKWKSIGTISSWNAVIAMRTYLFLARDLSFGGTNHEPSEVIKPVKVSFAGAMKMVMTGKITHAPSCVLILKVKELMV